MECDICLIEWDTYKHIPRMLYCGHTICEICLINIFNTNKLNGKEFFCPSCMTPHINIKSIEDIKNLIKNINLLRICEKIEIKKSILSSSIASSKNLDMSHNSLRNHISTSNLNNVNNPFSSDKRIQIISSPTKKNIELVFNQYYENNKNINQIKSNENNILIEQGKQNKSFTLMTLNIEDKQDCKSEDISQNNKTIKNENPNQKLNLNEIRDSNYDSRKIQTNFNNYTNLASSNIQLKPYNYTPSGNNSSNNINLSSNINNNSNNINAIKEKNNSQNNINLNNINNSTNDKNLVSSKDNSKINKNQISLTCKKHNKNTCCFISGTDKSLCSDCLKDNKTFSNGIPSGIKFYPTLHFLREGKNKINSSDVKSELLKQELSKLKEFFNIYREEFNKSNLKKIENFFNYIYKLIQYNYNIAVKVLHQCNKEQDTQIDLKLKEIDDLSEELNLIDSNLNEIRKENDSELYKYDDIINAIHDRLNSFLNYDYELNLMKMDINLKSDFKESLFELIQNSYEIDVDYLTLPDAREHNNEDPIQKTKNNCDENNYILQPTLKSILQKEKYWNCVCGETENFVGEFKCINCDRYRKLQTIDYFSDNPSSSFELLKQVVNNRRKDESKEFKRLLNESQAINKNNLIKNNKAHILSSENNSNTDQKEKLYFIDIEWFLSWKCYVMNDITEKTLPNNKKMIFYVKNLGYLPPNMITNENLFEDYSSNLDKKNFKKGLKINEDYVTISQSIWDFFVKNYGGGPIIYNTKDEENNLISKDIYKSTIFTVPKSIDIFEKLTPKCNIDSRTSKLEEFINNILGQNFNNNKPKLDINIKSFNINEEARDSNNLIPAYIIDGGVNKINIKENNPFSIFNQGNNHDTESSNYNLIDDHESCINENEQSLINLNINNLNALSIHEENNQSKKRDKIKNVDQQMIYKKIYSNDFIVNNITNTNKNNNSNSKNNKENYFYSQNLNSEQLNKSGSININNVNKNNVDNNINHSNKINKKEIRRFENNENESSEKKDNRSNSLNDNVYIVNNTNKSFNLLQSSKHLKNSTKLKDKNSNINANNISCTNINRQNQTCLQSNNEINYNLNTNNPTFAVNNYSNPSNIIITDNPYQIGLVNNSNNNVNNSLNCNSNSKVNKVNNIPTGYYNNPKNNNINNGNMNLNFSSRNNSKNKNNQSIENNGIKRQLSLNKSNNFQTDNSNVINLDLNNKFPKDYNSKTNNHQPTNILDKENSKNDNLNQNLNVNSNLDYTNTKKDEIVMFDFSKKAYLLTNIHNQDNSNNLINIYDNLNDKVVNNYAIPNRNEINEAASNNDKTLIVTNYSIDNSSFLEFMNSDNKYRHYRADSVSSNLFKEKQYIANIHSGNDPLISNNYNISVSNNNINNFDDTLSTIRIQTYPENKKDFIKEKIEEARKNKFNEAQKNNKLFN